MRYGLPREEKPKKEWKTGIENELRCLKMEVCFLKDQLKDTKNQLAAWTSPDRLDKFLFMQGCLCNENRHQLFSKNENNNNNCSNTNDSQPPFATPFNRNSNERVLNNSLASPQGNPFLSVSMGTDSHYYEPTWDYDSVTRKSLRMHSISCMPCYKNNSFEELRLLDYMSKGIGFSNQIQRYKDSIQRSARSNRTDFLFAPKNSKPVERKDSEQFSISGPKMPMPFHVTPKPPKPWPFGPSSGNKEKLNSPASSSVEVSVPQTSNDLKLQDEQKKSQPLSTLQINPKTQNNPDMKTNVFSNFSLSKKDENLSSQILLEVRKMGEQMSSINDRLSMMDSNLSDMNSQVSVMDSRLSAVDMFVTMQRFDKKWQDLELRLFNLETPSPAKVTTLPSNVGNSKDTARLSSQDSTPKGKIKISHSFKDEKINITQTSDFGKPNVTVTDPVKHQARSLSATDASGMNQSDFIRSVSCIDPTKGNSISLDISSASNSPLKINPDNAPIEMADLKLCNLVHCEAASALVENLSPRETKSQICNSESMPSVSENTNEQSDENASKNKENDQKSYLLHQVINVTPEAKKLTHEPELQKVTLDKDISNGLMLNDPLGVSEQKNSLVTVSVDLIEKEVENDAENEFVIVEKSDVEEPVEENSNVKTVFSPLNEASSSSEFKMYSDITEYLEINLGKKKNLVYEFGFEAKPSYSPESEDHEMKLDGNQENKVSTSSADDSFQQFKINFIENKSVHEKQSSPFVLCSSKSSEETPDGNNWKIKKLVRARRQRLLSEA